jgi:hypothetical protein
MLKLPPGPPPIEMYHRSVARLNTSPNRRCPLIPILRTTYIWSQLLGSFLWNIVWMIFGNVFGLLQICSTRWGSLPMDLPGFRLYVIGSENTWGFGQMVALLLLTLPLLAAGEAYSGMSQMRMHWEANLLHADYT